MTDLNNQIPVKGAQPLVAIAVPVYNGASFIEECLVSIQKQTYTNWVCMVLDNCSNDDTFQIAKSIADKDSRFQIYQNKDFLNVMQNWNEASKHIPEEAAYYKIVPADDLLFSDFLQEMVGLMEANPTVGICSSYRIDGVEIRGRGLDYFDGPVFNGKDVFEREIMSKIDVTGSANTYLVNMKYLRLLKSYPKFYNERNLHVDMELAYDLLNISDFGFVFKALSYTRRHAESITDSTTFRFNTSISSREQILYNYYKNNSKLTNYYYQIRLIYAAYYLKNKLKGNRECVQWHDKHIIRPFTWIEYMKAIFLKNRFSYKLSQKFKKK